MKPSTAVIDGDAGLGLVVAPKAMQVAIEKAEKAGTGWVAVRNSNHFGIAGYHASLALPHDMVGWAMTHAGPLVTPMFSKERLLGTNPICVVMPMPIRNRPLYLTWPPPRQPMASSKSCSERTWIRPPAGYRM